MDKSKDYIKMCSSARQLRCLWSPALGDFYYDCKTSEVKVVLAVPHGRRHQVWLPRQDQLLALAASSVKQLPPAYLVSSLYQFILAQTPNHCGSLEQIIIQFAMHELYRKRFHNKGWRAYASTVSQGNSYHGKIYNPAA